MVSQTKVGLAKLVANPAQTTIAMKVTIIADPVSTNPFHSVTAAIQLSHQTKLLESSMTPVSVNPAVTVGTSIASLVTNIIVIQTRPVKTLQVMTFANLVQNL